MSSGLLANPVTGSPIPLRDSNCSERSLSRDHGVESFDLFALVMNLRAHRGDVHVAAQHVEHTDLVTAGFRGLDQAARGVELGVSGKDGDFHRWVSWIISRWHVFVRRPPSGNSHKSKWPSLSPTATAKDCRDWSACGNPTLVLCDLLPLRE